MDGIGAANLLMGRPSELFAEGDGEVHEVYYLKRKYAPFFAGER